MKYIESYKHKLAKHVLIEWLKEDSMLIYVNKIIKIKTEEQFSEGGKIIFIPDLTIYSENGVCAFIEIIHRNILTSEKIQKINQYCKTHDWKDIMIIGIKADYILNQINKPDYIKKMIIVCL